MVRVKYPKRFLIHSSFIEWGYKEPAKSRIFMYLMRIHQHSAEHTKSHNIILDSEFDKIKHLSKGIHLLKASFKIRYEDDDDFIKYQKDEISKNVVAAIDLTSQSPYEVVILCSPEYEEQFRKNPHAQMIKSIKIKSNDIAINLLEQQFKLFIIERQCER